MSPVSGRCRGACRSVEPCRPSGRALRGWPARRACGGRSRAPGGRPARRRRRPGPARRAATCGITLPWPVWALATAGVTTCTRPWLAASCTRGLRQGGVVGAIQRGHQRTLAAVGQRAWRGQHRGRAAGWRRGRTPPRRAPAGAPGRVAHARAAPGRRSRRPCRIGVDQRLRVLPSCSTVVCLLERGQAGLHRFQLRAAHQRAHAHGLVARVADGDAGQLRADGLGRRAVQRFGAPARGGWPCTSGRTSPSSRAPLRAPAGRRPRCPGRHRAAGWRSSGCRPRCWRAPTNVATAGCERIRRRCRRSR
jgi:hypothetical protein